MRIDFPQPHQIPQLKKLWQKAFGDTVELIDHFFATAYASSRCRCVSLEGKVVAALYWFDVFCREQQFAYIYAVATDPDYRNRGLCRKLMEDTHAHLALQGYRGVLLVPEGDSLRQMYTAFGYENATALREYFCTAGDVPAPMHRIDREEFALLRQKLLPEGSVIQEEGNLLYLEGQVRFYAGMGFLAALHQEGDNVFCPEILGNPGMAPGILLSLGAAQGTFRCPGQGKDFAMFLPLEENAEKPVYFAFAFD